VTVAYSQPAAWASASSFCSPTSFDLSAKTRVGYHSTPASPHVFLFLSQSTKLILAKAS